MILHISKRLAGRLPYYQRTFPAFIIRSKKDATESLIAEVAKLRPADGSKRIRVLSLPGPWWNFERSLTSAMGKRKINVSFTCCEPEPTVFRLSAARMPHKRRQDVERGSCVRSKFCAELANADVVTNGHSTTLINCHVADYIKVAQKQFECIFLDCSSPITEGMLASLDACREHLAPGGALAFAFMAARENLKTLKLLYPYKSRITFMKDYCETNDLEYVRCWSWNDGSPMIQMLFRDQGIGKHETLAPETPHSSVEQPER